MAGSDKNSFLQIEGLSMRFGGLLAVDGIAFDVKEREIFAIIGPNGAGKTTVFNCISGFYRPTTGAIRLQGRDIAGQGSHSVALHGLVRTFQNVRLFKHMTVLENLLVAQHMDRQRPAAGEHLAAPHVKAHVVDRQHAAKAHAEVLGRKQDFVGHRCHFNLSDFWKDFCRLNRPLR